MKSRFAVNAYMSEFEQYKKFFQDLMHSKFNGVWVFGSYRALNGWRTRWEDFLANLGGSCRVDRMTWRFPWGARLHLLVVQRAQDYNSIRGMELSTIEYDYSVSPEFINLKVVMAQIRITLPEVKR